MKKCTLLLNTKWGYVLKPVCCKSIKEAIDIARETGLAYRIFVNGELKKSGWIVEV